MSTLKYPRWLYSLVIVALNGTQGSNCPVSKLLFTSRLSIVNRFTPSCKVFHAAEHETFYTI